MTVAPPPRRHPHEATGRLVVLDGLRLLAVLMLAGYLLAAYRPGAVAAWGVTPQAAFGRVSAVAAYGWLGAGLLLMITGFVVCASSWGRTATAFARDRVVRLVPALVPITLVTVVLLAVRPITGQAAQLGNVVANVTLLYRPLNGSSQYGPAYWMLWVVVLFYVFFAGLLWRGLTRRRAVLFGYTWLLAAILSMTGEHAVVRTLFQPEFAAYLVAGIAFALIHRFGPDITLWGLVGLSWVLSLHFALVRLDYFVLNGPQRRLSEVVVGLVVTLWFGLLTVVALGRTDRLRGRGVPAAAAVVYPFSLLQAYVGWILIHAVRDLRPRWLVLAAVVLLLLIAAWLVHRLIERPLAAHLRRRLSDDQPPNDRLPDEHPDRPAGAPVVTR